MSQMGQERRIEAIDDESGLLPILLKKSEYRLGPIFSAPWARFSDADAGGLVIRLRLNGASSKSICGGSYRQSKMSFVFWQFCNDVRLSDFFNRILPIADELLHHGERRKGPHSDIARGYSITASARARRDSGI